MSRPKGSISPLLSTQQKEQIVLDYKDNDLTFKELSIKYNVSYSAVRKWCIDYEEFGINELIAKTGKNSRERSTSIDPKDREIARLRKELKKSQMEADILKKFDELMKEQARKK